MKATTMPTSKAMEVAQQLMDGPLCRVWPAGTREIVATLIDQHTAQLVQEARLEGARLEKLEKVYQAARGLCYGTDWNNGTHAITHRYRKALLKSVHDVEPIPSLDPQQVINESMK